MRIGRRKIIFTVAWVVALVAIGVGVVVAVPSNDTNPTAIKVTGPAVIDRPQGKTLIAGTWGPNSGQFSRDTGGWCDGPTQIAVSQDGGTIAILDNTYLRVQLYSRDGTFEGIVPVTEGPALADIAFDKQGRLVILSWNDGEYVLRIKPDEQDRAEKYPIGSGIFPQELAIDGDDVWVTGEGSVSYQVIGPDGPVNAEAQSSTARVGTPHGDETYQALGQSPGNFSVLLKNDNTDTTRTVEIVCSDLPLDDVRSLGIDAAGNFYVMVRTYKEGWAGTSSWCFIAVAPDGSCLGQLCLPLDYYAGGGWTVTPEGTLLELRSTEAGIEVAEFELGGEQ